MTSMVWSWNDIDREWLAGSVIAVEPTEAVDAFETVERLLGREWIETKRVYSIGSTGALVETSGAGPTLQVVSMGKKLRAVENALGAAQLIDRVKTGDRAAVSELTAIYLATVPGSEIEIGPDAQVGDSVRRPDFKVRDQSEEWTYVEVTAPDEAETAERGKMILERIVSLLPTLPAGTGIEVFLLCEPNDGQVESLVSAVERAVHDGTPRVEEINGLALLTMSQGGPPGQLVLQDHGKVFQPRMGCARFELVGDQAKSIAVRIPYTDERAEAFITREARQLPTTAPGLIMIDMNRAQTGLKAWGPLIQRRLQPTQHTRVSAVCLFTQAISLTGDALKWQSTTRYIANRHARQLLPGWLETQLRSFGTNADSA
jgi:hypothetical protein